MSTPVNPFVRGYSNLISERVAVILDDDDWLIYRPLHAIHNVTDDINLIGPCVYSDETAVAAGSLSLLKDSSQPFRCTGTVVEILHSIYSQGEDAVIHVADTTSARAAQAVIDRLRFDTGFYSRCWEISAAHLTDADTHYLYSCANSAETTDLYFEMFSIPASEAFGVKLIATPWTDGNLEADSIRGEALRDEQLKHGVPPTLVDVLHLAALADVRILIFDPEAPVLDGLPVHRGLDAETTR